MVRVPNRGSVRFLNLIIHYVNGEIFGTEKRWSVIRDGPLCEAVRYRVSTVLIFLVFFYILLYTTPSPIRHSAKRSDVTP